MLTYSNSLKVCIDDLIGVIQSDDLKVICHATHVMLHDIHSMFPPQTSGHSKDDLISFKKLPTGNGIWAI
jgi:hypothetical protein